MPKINPDPFAPAASLSQEALDLPTLAQEARLGSFAGCINSGTEHGKLPARGAHVGRHGSSAWITRVADVKTYTHPIELCLELAREPQMEAWLDVELGSKSTAESYFWPRVTNENMARCFCGDIGAARELMDHIENLWAQDHEMREMLLEQLTDNGNENDPLQAYLVVSEVDGLGLVHFAYNYDWDGAYKNFERCLRESAPELFARLPWTFESDDYFGTYDEYGSESFTRQTSVALSVALTHSAINPGEHLELIAHMNSENKAWAVELAAHLRSSEEARVLNENTNKAASISSPRL